MNDEDDDVLLSIKYEPSDKMTYHNKRQISLKFADVELVKKACDACKKTKKHCNGIRRGLFDEYSRDCFYEYLATLPPEKQDEYYQQIVASDKRSLEPCCEFCRYLHFVFAEDIPGSYFTRWWRGECMHSDTRYTEISSDCSTSPEWCPIRKIKNYKPEDWMIFEEFVVLKGDPFDGRF